MGCEHLFKHRKGWWRHRVYWYRWRCIRCGFLTRSYDSCDGAALRPIHPYMSVAVRGFNTTKDEA